MESVQYELRGEQLELLPEKAVWWTGRKTMLLADLHIGKITHFRKNHIPVPVEAAEKNFKILEGLLMRYQPARVYFLGDLFHSYYNKEWELLIFLLAKFPKVRFDLVTGNHDVLLEEHYDAAGIACHEHIEVGPFYLTHHPSEHPNLYNLCGHVHPGVKIKGEGRQVMKLPCFFFGRKGGILPAFGSFTGNAALQPHKQDDIFAIAGRRIFLMSRSDEKKV